MGKICMLNISYICLITKSYGIFKKSILKLQPVAMSAASQLYNSVCYLKLVIFGGEDVPGPHPLKTITAEPTTHNHCFTCNSPLPLLSKSLQRNHFDQNFRCAFIWYHEEILGVSVEHTHTPPQTSGRPSSQKYTRKAVITVVVLEYLDHILWPHSQLCDNFTFA